jgi:ABC-2 type transport system permease protein
MPAISKERQEEGSFMRREGSALSGVGVVFLKELADHLTGARVLVLECLIAIVAFVALYGGIQEIRAGTPEDPFLFLHLFNKAHPPVPDLVSLLSILVPVLAIGIGFDAVNSEHSRRTLSRILAQPIYRDALLFGKFLAGLATLSISLVALWLLVIGVGLCWLGVPPGPQEIARGLAFLVATVAYASVWLALAMLCSILFRSAATAALVAFGLWLVFTVLWRFVAQAIAGAILTADDSDTAATVVQALARLSPSTLFAEIMLPILDPTRGFSDLNPLMQLYMAQAFRIMPNAPLPLGESIMIAMPQFVALVAGAILLFVIGYVAFQRQEVRA